MGGGIWNRRGYLEWMGVFGMGGGIWNGWGYLEWEEPFGMGGGVGKKIPLLLQKIVEFGKIVVIEFIDMSGVLVFTTMRG